MALTLVKNLGLNDAATSTSTSKHLRADRGCEQWAAYDDGQLVCQYVDQQRRQLELCRPIYPLPRFSRRVLLRPGRRLQPSPQDLDTGCCSTAPQLAGTISFGSPSAARQLSVRGTGGTLTLVT